MIRLIANIVFFVVLAVFVAMNTKFTTQVNLFGFKMEDVSSVAIILIAMAVGVVYSFSFYLTNYFVKRSKTRQKGRKMLNTQKSKELNEREKLLEAVGNEIQAPDQEAPQQASGGETEKIPGIFGRKKKGR